MLLHEIRKDPDSFAEMGRRQKLAIAGWRRAAEKRKKQLNDPKYDDFIHDIDAYTGFESMSDEDLGKIMAVSTLTNLTALGYKGMKAEDGDTIVPVFTAVLHKIKEECGRSAVIIGRDESQMRAVRRGRPALLFKKLMEELVAELQKMTKGGKGQNVANNHSTKITPEEKKKILIDRHGFQTVAAAGKKKDRKDLDAALVKMSVAELEDYLGL